MSSDIDVVAHAALRHPRDEGHMTSCAELNISVLLRAMLLYRASSSKLQCSMSTSKIFLRFFALSSTVWVLVAGTPTVILRLARGSVSP